MNFNEIGQDIYNKFVSLGGKFDVNKMGNGVAEPCNTPIINKIFSELMLLRVEDRPKYLQILKVLVLNGYAVLSVLPPREVLDDVESLIQGFRYVARESTTVSDLINSFEEDRKQINNLTHILQTSKNIDKLDQSLSYMGLMYTLKGFIVGLIAYTDKDIIYAGQYETLKNPENMTILSRYFTYEEFSEIYYNMIKNHVVKHPLEQAYMLHQLFLYTLANHNLAVEDAVKEAYEMHLFFVKNFSHIMHDTYYYHLSRPIYAGLIFAHRSGLLDLKSRVLFDQFVNPSTRIETIKEDLTPDPNNEETIPLMFDALKYYADPNITVEFMESIKPALTEYENRFINQIEQREGYGKY